jgi:opacity protein-like surface antigen
MKGTSLAAAALVLAAAAGPVLSDDAPAAPFYVEAAIGHISLDRGSLSPSIANGGGINGTGTAASLLGGYSFDEHFGVELGYHDYGHPTAFVQSGLVVTECPASFSCPKITGLTAELTGRIELVPDLDGMLRAGMLAWQVGAPGQTLLKDTRGNSFIYGLGVLHHFGNGLSLDISYERSSFTTEETRVGLRYSF